MLNTEDLDVFFDADEFAEGVIITTGEGEIFDILGIFDTPFKENQGGLVEIESSDPFFLAKATDAINISDGDIVKIRETEYRVLRQEPSGDGMVRVVLSHAKFEY